MKPNMLINRIGNRMKKKSSILDLQRSSRSRRAMLAATAQPFTSATLHSPHCCSHRDAVAGGVTKVPAGEFEEDI